MHGHGESVEQFTMQATNVNGHSGVPGIIVHQRGICVYGPPARDSLKASTPGYPKQGQVYSGQKSAGRQLGMYWWFPYTFWVLTYPPVGWAPGMTFIL